MSLPMTNVAYFYISTFQSVCSVPTVAIFFSSLIPLFPDMLFRFFMNHFEMVPLVLLLLASFLFSQSTTLYCYCKIFILQNLFGFFLDHIYISWNCNVYYQTCSFFIMDYDVQFIARDGCQFSFVDSIIWFAYFLNLILVILGYACTSDPCLILPLFPCICYT